MLYTHELFEPWMDLKITKGLIFKGSLILIIRIGNIFNLKQLMLHSKY